MKENVSTIISVEQAKSIIASNVVPLPVIRMPLERSAFLMLAEDVIAPNDVPGFRQSAMDGYAIKYLDYVTGGTLLVKDEMAAGEIKQIQIIQNQAVRIFTGAAIPAFADTVVVQEKVRIVENRLIILDNKLQQGDNVRGQGSEVNAGTIALKSGGYLGPGAIGFLASIGVTEVVVFPRPGIHLIITGKELKKPGEKLLRGQVYEANSYTLHAALQKLHFNDVKTHFVDDDLQALKEVLKTALVQADLILITGGVSVGDYDFVIESTIHCAVTQMFHQIKQKPGKPLYFGMKDRIPVFGLPGNPASVLTCFYEYVLPALANICQQEQLLLPVQYKKLTKAVKKKAGLTCFLKGYFKEDMVEPLVAQESYRLSSFARSNCLICLSNTKEIYHPGEIVEIHTIH